ncbi:hypothetical protein QPK77_08260 [Providencia rettgeri]|nr:hypothetical protein [Providencia rettgeri]MDK3007931.1 hypothetical protein [Providencia rettgeri]
MKEEAKEIVQAVSEAAKDRIKNPVMATFVISWCVFNWSSLLVLIFGKESIQQKVQIASVAFSDMGSWLIPIFFTAAYLFLNKPLNLVFQRAMVGFDYISMSIEHSKKIRELDLEKTRESLRAEKDMIYEETKTRQKKYIQTVNEEIAKSKEREELLAESIKKLTAESDKLKHEIYTIENNSQIKINEIERLKDIIKTLNQENQKLNLQLEKLKTDKKITKSENLNLLAKSVLEPEFSNEVKEEYKTDV